MKASKYKTVVNDHKQSISAFAGYLQNLGYALDTIRTETNYTAFFLAWLEEVQTPQAETTYNDLLCFIEQCTALGDSRSLINRKLSAIRKYYNYLLREGVVTKNPASGLFVKNKGERIPSNLLTGEELTELYENYPVVDLRTQRNKVMVGLLVYQGVTRQELERLEVIHVKLTTGKIEIPGSKHSSSRVLKLESTQILPLSQYITHTRNEILKGNGCYGLGRKPIAKGDQNEPIRLFISMYGVEDIKNSFLHLIRALRGQNPKLINAQQIRQSVITLWLRTKDLRTTQYMAGHRYVSSTERYQINHLEDLQDALDQFHPLK